MTGPALLSVEEVSVTFATDTGPAPAAIEVSYSVAAGEVLAVVGESGSGKTVTAMALLGLLPPSATVTGAAHLAGTNLFGLDRERLREIRGSRVGFVFQEPMSALNPVFTVGAQVAEAITVHRRVSAAAARARAAELLGLVGLPDPRRAMRSYPHELSGGQLQRVVIAMAVANEPELLIADEPTTALDVTVQAGILELLRDLRSRLGMGILLITHDMGVVADLADRVVVMHQGRVVEQGDVTEIFARPRREYTRQLLGSVISLAGTPTPPPNGTAGEFVRVGDHVAVVGHPATMSVVDGEPVAPVLRISDLSVVYQGRFRAFALRAVDRVSLHVEPGEVLGLVGESGSGKTTVASSIVGLVPATSGRIEVAGTELAALGGRARRAALSRIGMVFQDPSSSLNPRATVGASIAEPLRLHSDLPRAERDGRVRELLDAVALPAAMAGRFPHELSGGQRQRVGDRAGPSRCARRCWSRTNPPARWTCPCRRASWNCCARLQAELKFACLFISHDLAVIEELAGRTAVMHRGHIVEQGPTGSVLNGPLHPYTHLLITSAPVADPADQRRRRAAWRAALPAGR